MSAAPFTDTSILQEPLLNLLLERKPDCIIHDVFHRWSAEAIDRIGILRITFSGNGCFPRCVQENMARYKPHEKVGSDLEPFVVPGLPDRIELTRSQLPFFARQGGLPRRMTKPDENSFGVAVNSFYELEPAYVEYFQKELGNKAWLVGPVSLCNRNVEDKAERGQKTAIDEQSILNSLNRKIFQSTEKEQGSQKNWLPNGFEDRIKESQKGLIIKGWAPQLLILEHIAVGGFMTHCGWNSTLEGVSAGVPMITWPITAEQFTNEKLITDVLKIGVKVGSMEWLSWSSEPSAAVKRDNVETAVKRLMGGDEEAAEMRSRAKDLGEKAKRVVEEGGSSYNDANALIQELQSRREIETFAGYG
ncbi:hypothetical protein GH714_015879 [Hevea brasiliensis]|uniref:anthocyanidin 3-O-glucosyltransferase n=1 Tax=Hevea brasiliensis TaxID=3981 RepID=A0A6A6L081_HEVBR|nr:hypothetical protein GH714_015879 [Hevea brasiliensis]